MCGRTINICVITPRTLPGRARSVGFLLSTARHPLLSRSAARDKKLLAATARIALSALRRKTQPSFSAEPSLCTSVTCDQFLLHTRSSMRLGGLGSARYLAGILPDPHLSPANFALKTAACCSDIVAPVSPCRPSRRGRPAQRD